MSDLKTAAREAFVYGLPLIEVATTRQRGIALGQTMGAFTHVRSLANHKHRAVTRPTPTRFIRRLSAEGLLDGRYRLPPIEPA